MVTCWYCEKEPASAERYGKPICEECNSHKIQVDFPPGVPQTQDDNAHIWKLIIRQVGRETEKDSHKRIDAKAVLYKAGLGTANASL